MSIEEDEDVPFEEESDFDDSVPVEEEEVVEDDTAKLTGESVYLDISKLTYEDRREKQRRHSRRKGWKPPDTRNVNITSESYDIIRSLAKARGQRHSPFYEEVNEIVKEYCRLKEEIELKQGFLDLALKDKEELKTELSKLKLDISKLNDQGVIFP